MLEYSAQKAFEDSNSEWDCFLTPFQRKLLLKNLEQDLRPEYRQRIEIMLLADRGYSQSQICTTLNCSQETARYWIFMAQTGQAHKWNAFPIGRPKKINDKYLARLQVLVTNSPREFGYAFERWTAQWLSKQLAKEFGIEVSDRHINRLLKKMGLSTRSNQTETVTEPEPTEADNHKIAIRDLSSSSAPKLPDLGLFKPNQNSELGLF